LSVASAIDIGSDAGGTGTLTIKNGATITSAGTYAFVGQVSGSTGSVSIQGPAALWSMSSQLTVGNQGNGTVTVNEGTLIVSSAGPILGTTGIEVGGYGAGVGGGDGKLAVQDGGTVESDGSLDFIGHISDGTVAVDGAGSLWKSEGQLLIGNQGNGQLTVTDGGSAIVGGLLLQEDARNVVSLSVDDTSAMEIGETANAIEGQIVVDDHSEILGAGNILGDVTNNGTISALEGTLVISGDVNGTGTLDVGADATLEIQGTLSDTISDNFTGDGVLKLDSALPPTDTLTIADGGTLKVEGALDTGDTFDFGGAGVLEIDDLDASTTSVHSAQATVLAVTNSATEGTDGMTIASTFGSSDTIWFKNGPSLTLSAAFYTQDLDEVSIYSGTKEVATLHAAAEASWANNLSRRSRNQ
jgi:T5SS/PEP-CTERM-associated repeat protein